MYYRNMNENVVITNSAWKKSDIEILFGDEEVHFTECDELSALMRELGVFPSASQARKAGRHGPIPEGWSHEFKASKKVRLWIWNPTE